MWFSSGYPSFLPFHKTCILAYKACHWALILSKQTLGNSSLILLKTNLITAGSWQRQHEGWPTASFAIRHCRWYGLASFQRSEAFCCRKDHDEAELLWGSAEGHDAKMFESLSIFFSVKKIQNKAVKDDLDEDQLKVNWSIFWINFHDSVSNWTKSLLHCVLNPSTALSVLSKGFVFNYFNFTWILDLNLFTKFLLRI